MKELRSDIKNKKLVTLDEFNEGIIELYNLKHEMTKKKNGIECPECQSELLDVNFGYKLNAGLVTKDIICSNHKCKYTGTRFMFN